MLCSTCKGFRAAFPPRAGTSCAPSPAQPLLHHCSTSSPQRGFGKGAQFVHRRRAGLFMPIYHLSAQVQPSDGAEQDPLQAGTTPGTNSVPSSPWALRAVPGKSPRNRGLGSSPRTAPSCQQERSVWKHSGNKGEKKTVQMRICIAKKSSRYSQVQLLLHAISFIPNRRK